MRKLLLIILLIQSFLIHSQDGLNVRYFETPLSEVLADLEVRTGTFFSFNADLVRSHSISLSAESLLLAEVLELIANQTGIVFERISENQVVLRENTGLWNICGYLRSTETGEVLPFATISAGTRGTTTNEEGYFELKDLSPGTRVRIGYIGHKEVVLTLEETAWPDCGSIFLLSEPQELDEVIVKSYLTTGVNKNTDGSFTMVESEMGIFPGLAERDILQSIQMTPGINSLDESASDLQIRGGSQDQNLVLFDGIKMYNTGHFFGMISAFNPYVVERAKIYKGGARPEYGDRISGVLDISTANEIPLRTEGGLGANGTHGDVFLKTPLGERAGLVISGRRSYTDLFQTPTFDALSEKVFQNTKVVTTEAGPGSGNGGDDDDDDDDDDDEFITGREEFYFYDASTKLLWKPSENSLVMLAGIYTRNELDFSVNDDEDIASDLFVIENKGGSIQWDGDLGGRWDYQFNAYYSAFDSDYSNEVSEDEEVEELSLRRNTVQDIGANAHLGYELFPGHRLLAGYQYSGTEVLFELRHDEAIDGNNPGSGRNYDILRSETLNAHSLYSEYRWSPENKGLLSAGLRASRYGFSDEYFLEPRMNVEYPLFRPLRLKGTFERRYQPISQLVEFEDIQIRLENSIWTLSDGMDIPVLESTQGSAGLLFTLDNWTIDVDGYLRNISGLTTFTNGFTTAAASISSGESNIRGLDLLIRKQYNGYFFWLAYTFNEVEYRFPALQQDPFPGNNDIRHQLSLANTLQLGNWEFSLGWQYRGGTPFTPVESFDPDTGTIDYGPINSVRLPEFHRMDASLLFGFGPEEGRIRGELGAAFRNLYARRVPLSVFYRRDINLQTGQVELNQIRQLSLGFTPNVVFRLFF